jgi:hypothetical protein
MFNCSSSSFWPFKRPQRCRFKALYTKKKEAGFQPGLPGSTLRVDRISPGQLPTGFLRRPGPVPGPGRPDSGSTCWAGPGFKSTSRTIHYKSILMNSQEYIRLTFDDMKLWIVTKCI